MSDRRKLRKDSPDDGLTNVGHTHCFHCGAQLPEPELPTTALPGSDEKIRVMRARAERRMPLRNPDDWETDSATFTGG